MSAGWGIRVYKNRLYGYWVVSLEGQRKVFRTWQHAYDFAECYAGWCRQKCREYGYTPDFYCTHGEIAQWCECGT